VSKSEHIIEKIVLSFYFVF